MASSRLAYPNYSDIVSSTPKYDLSKWLKSMQDIYVRTHLGATKNAAVEEITKDWNRMEKINFLNWLKYYESGDINKYKTAQNHSYYVNDDINYFLPNPPNQKTAPPSPLGTLNNSISPILPQPEPKLDPQEERRKLVEDQRRKILGRLNSAEKLLSSHQGQIFAGTDFEKLLNSIYELKKQIQTVNKINLSAQTCIDLIIRQANILNRGGHKNPASFLIKLAQNTPGDFSFNLGDTPAGGSQPQGQGALGNNNPTGQDLLATPPAGLDADPAASDETDGIKEFLDNMESGGFNDNSEAEDDNLDAKDEVDVGDDDVLLDQENIPDDKELVVKEAQELPRAPAAPQGDQMPRQVAPRPKREAPTDLEVESPASKPDADLTTEDVKNGPNVEQATTDYDALIDSAFANLTVADVVNKLESINNIFRNREISRQLAIVDVMLNRLGIAAYFPTLGESINKQLEANNYCLTRVEDILSKLRSSMGTKSVDLEGTPDEPNSQLAQTLDNAEKKEKSKKEMRKQVEDKTLEDKAKPDASVDGIQDMQNQPVEVENTPQRPAPPERNVRQAPAVR
jgi:hypothetical protein